ncbi:MAG TPA: hypothetical protein VFK51_04970 [Burkholderiales bacterium]|jgi:hypothetical protein|nr:hypothetical protein [Burkholderiales bacterium]
MTITRTNKILSGFVTRFVIVISAIGLAGCGGGGPSGTYATRDGKMQFTFNSGGKLDITMAGMTQQGTYSVENGKITYHDMGGRGEVMTTDGNGCLDSRFFGKLCKQ